MERVRYFAPIFSPRSAGIILENAVETTDSANAHGRSIKYKFAIIHPAGEGTSINISPWN
jgi:hypothetical protein